MKHPAYEDDAPDWRPRFHAFQPVAELLDKAEDVWSDEEETPCKPN